MHSETDAADADAPSDATADAGSPTDAADAPSDDAADADTPSDAATGRPGLGRKILLWVGAGVVAVSGIVGWIVGSNGAETVPETTIFGTGLSIPTTPATLALYGIVVSVVLLGTLFGLVELASRVEGGA